MGGLGDDVSQVTLRAAFIPFGPLKTIDIVSRKSRIFFFETVTHAQSSLTKLSLIYVSHNEYNIANGLSKGYSQGICLCGI